MIKWIVILVCLVNVNVWAKITVTQQDGRILTLEKPAQRVIALSPHITELLFAAGADHRVVGVSDYSNFPQAATALPIVSDSHGLNIERIIVLKPDLVVAWQKGNSAKQIAQLQKLNLSVLTIDTTKLLDIPTTIEIFGKVMGTSSTANQVANNWRNQLMTLTQHYAHLSPMSVFYQVWHKPLLTLNGGQIISDAIAVCGGVNIFAHQKMIAPMVSVEAVLKQNPDVIIVTSGSDMTMWQRYPMMLAVKEKNVFEINADLMNRAGPRMLLGVANLCEKLDLARGKKRST